MDRVCRGSDRCGSAGTTVHLAKIGGKGDNYIVQSPREKKDEGLTTVRVHIRFEGGKK